MSWEINCWMWYIFRCKMPKRNFFVFCFHQGEVWIFLHIKNINFVMENWLQAKVAWSSNYWQIIKPVGHWNVVYNLRIVFSHAVRTPDLYSLCLSAFLSYAEKLAFNHKLCNLLDMVPSSDSYVDHCCGQRYITAC